jgi:hypothetical protein
MTYDTFEAAGTQTAVPPTGYAMPPNGAGVVYPPNTGYWAGTAPTPPVGAQSPNKSYWIIIVGVAAVAIVAGVVSAFALRSGSTSHPSSVATKSATSGQSGSQQGTSSSQGTSSQQSTSSQGTSSSSQQSTQQSGNDSAAASEQYLYDLNSQGGDFLSVTDSDLLAYGNAVCSDFQAGNTVEQTVDDALGAANSNTQGLTQSDLADIVAAATDTLCPAYGPEVQAWAQENG